MTPERARRRAMLLYLAAAWIFALYVTVRVAGVLHIADMSVLKPWLLGASAGFFAAGSNHAGWRAGYLAHQKTDPGRTE